MKITDLKAKHLKIAEEISEKHGEAYKSHKIGVQKYMASVGNWKLFTRNDNYTIRNQLVIGIWLEGGIFPTLNEKDKQALHEQFLNMVEYWKTYAKLKGYDHVIYMGDKDKEQVVKVVGEFASKGIKKELLPLLHVIAESYQGTFLGGNISKEYEESLLNFLTGKEVLEKVVPKFPLLTLSHKNFMNLLRGPSLEVKYHGEEFSLSMVHPTNDKFLISYGWSSGKESQEVALTEEALTNFFHDVEMRNQLKNEFEPPKEHFKNWIKQTNHRIEEEGLKESFETLKDALGSWEAVESFSKRMIDEKMEDKTEDIYSASLFTLKESIGIDRYQVDDINYFHIQKEWKDKNHNTKFSLEIYISKDEFPEYIKQQVSAFMLRPLN